MAVAWWSMAVANPRAWCWPVSTVPTKEHQVCFWQFGQKHAHHQPAGGHFVRLLLCSSRKGFGFRYHLQDCPFSFVPEQVEWIHKGLSFLMFNWFCPINSQRKLSLSVVFKNCQQGEPVQKTVLPVNKSALLYCFLYCNKCQKEYNESNTPYKLYF